MIYDEGGSQLTVLFGRGSLSRRLLINIMSVVGTDGVIRFTKYFGLLLYVVRLEKVLLGLHCPRLVSYHSCTWRGRLYRGSGRLNSFGSPHCCCFLWDRSSRADSHFLGTEFPCYGLESVAHMSVSKWMRSTSYYVRTFCDLLLSMVNQSAFDTPHSRSPPLL